MSNDAVVFIVDDDASVRDSLRRLFESLAYPVRVFPNASAFLSVAGGEVYGCLILDVQLPDLDGLEVQKRLADIGAQIPVVFLTGQGDIPMTVRAMKGGALEFLTKPVADARLVSAVRAAIETARAARAERGKLADLRRRYDCLTARERDVMAGVVAGLLNKQIAAEFGTAEATVKEQRAHVMSKMQAASVAELVRFAAQLGSDTQTPR